MTIVIIWGSLKNSDMKAKNTIATYILLLQLVYMSVFYKGCLYIHTKIDTFFSSL